VVVAPRSTNRWRVPIFSGKCQEKSLKTELFFINGDCVHDRGGHYVHVTLYNVLKYYFYLTLPL